MITITYERDTKDYAIRANGELIGYRGTYREALALKAAEDAKRLKAH